MPTESFLDQVRAAAHDRQRVLRLALAHFQAETGTIHELGSDGVLHLTAWTDGIPDHLLPLIRDVPVGKGIAGLAVERKEPVDLCNLQTDDSGTARPKARDTAFSNPRMSLKWAKAEKGRLQGEDLLSERIEGFERGGGQGGGGSCAHSCRDHEGFLELPLPPPLNVESGAVRPR